MSPAARRSAQSLAVHVLLGPEPFGDVLGRVAWVEGEVLTRAGDRGLTGGGQLGKLSGPLQGKGFSAAVAEMG